MNVRALRQIKFGHTARRPEDELTRDLPLLVAKASWRLTEDIGNRDLEFLFGR